MTPVNDQAIQIHKMSPSKAAHDRLRRRVHVSHISSPHLVSRDLALRTALQRDWATRDAPRRIPQLISMGGAPQSSGGRARRGHARRSGIFDTLPTTTENSTFGV